MTAFPVQRRVFLTGLGAWASSASAAERGTVASFSVLANIVRRVSGDRLPVISLVPVNMDAHGWQPTAADLRAVASAAVLVENGLGLEGWISRLATASGFKGRLVVASTGVTPRFIREGKVTSLDPHAWQDPRNGMIYARNIAEGLAAADPDHASEYRANAATYAAELEALDIWISERFASIPVKARRINLGRKPGSERDQRLRQRMAQRAEAGGSSSRKAEYRDAFCSKASQRVKRAGCVGNQQVEAAPGSDVVAKFRDGERRRLVPQPAKEPGHRWAQAARH